MYNIAITLINGHSINVPVKDKIEESSLINSVLSRPYIRVKIRSGDEILIITNKVSYVTIYKD